jgi:hypothetical protein
MSNIEENSSPPNIHIQTPPTAPPATDRDYQTTANGGIAGILKRWKREDLIKRGSLGLRGIALLFSLISFIAMASNKHGDWRDFDKYEEYRYKCSTPFDNFVFRLMGLDQNLIFLFLPLRCACNLLLDSNSAPQVVHSLGTGPVCSRFLKKKITMNSQSEKTIHNIEIFRPPFFSQFNPRNVKLSLK